MSRGREGRRRDRDTQHDKPKTRETELKLTLENPRDAEEIVAFLESRGYQCAPGARVRNDDIYLDTFEWTLLKNGMALRLRRTGGRPFYTLKSVGTVKDGVADRYELELPARKNPSDPTEVPVKAIRAVIDPLIRPRRLMEQVMARTERRTFELSKGKDAVVELAFDSTRFQPRGLNPKRIAPRFHEMEAELVSGGAEALVEISRLVTARFACRPSAKSKLETAIERLKIVIPSKKPPQHLTVRLEDRFDLALRKILAFQIRRVYEHISGAYLDIDTEFVHQARVSTRRMRSALRLFEDALPARTAKHLRDELGWIAAAFGEVRDLDVFILNLPGVFEKIGSASPRDKRALERWVGERRFLAHAALKAALDSKRFGALRSRFQRYLEAPLPDRPRSPLAGQTVGEAAPGIILEKYGAVIAQGRAVLAKPNLKSFHKLRIQMKRLRYACEFVAPAYSDALEPFIEKTVDIQDCLGELQDTVFTRSYIEGIMDRWKGMAVNPGLLFLLGEIHQLQGEISRSKQREFGGIWREFDRPEVAEELRGILGAPSGAADNVGPPTTKA
jgi:inorganic triphosphatase YgiF